MTRILDFDEAYQEVHTEPGEKTVVIYKGEEHLVEKAEIPIFTRMRMAVLSSGNYEEVSPSQLEQLIDVVKESCPTLSDEMETWNQVQFTTFMSVFKGDEDDDPNASTASEEEPVERLESSATVTD